MHTPLARWRENSRKVSKAARCTKGALRTAESWRCQEHGLQEVWNHTMLSWVQFPSLPHSGEMPAIAPSSRNSLSARLLPSLTCVVFHYLLTHPLDRDDHLMLCVLVSCLPHYNRPHHLNWPKRFWLQIKDSSADVVWRGFVVSGSLIWRV